MPRYETTLGTINYLDEGSGEPLLLLHGVGNSLDLWRDVIPSLAAGYRVIAADFLGHGDSSGPRRHLTIPDMADVLAEFMTGIGITRFAVAGTSLGGLVSLELAARHGEHITAIVCNGTPTSHLESQRMGRFLFVAELVGDGELPANLDAITGSGTELAERKKTDILKSARWYMPTLWAVAAYNPVDRLSRVECPALVLMGYQDFHMATAYVLADGIRDAKLSVIPNAGHLTPYDDPKGVATAIDDFLREKLTAR